MTNTIENENSLVGEAEMTEREIIENLKVIKHYYQPKLIKETINNAIEALTEKIEYNKLGTLEDLKEMKEIVGKITMEEKQNEIYKIAAEKIKGFYKTGKPVEVGRAIEEVGAKNKKIAIIKKYYEEGKTLEKIAEEMQYDQSIISKEKKKLCIKIYWEIFKTKKI